MFELTGVVSYILPIMITILISKFVGELTEKESIYNALIIESGFPYLSKEKSTQKDIVKNILTLVTPDTCIHLNSNQYEDGYYKIDHQTIKTLLDFSFKGFPVLKNGLFMGFVPRDQLQKYKTLHWISEVWFSMDLQNVSNSIDDEQLVFVGNDYLRMSENQDVWVLLEYFKRLGLKYVFIVENQRLIGMVTKKDLLCRT